MSVKAKPSETQAVIFFKPSWNITTSKKWLRDNKIIPILINGKPKEPDTDLFKGQIRYRITDPKQYVRFTTKPLIDKEGKPANIHLILGWKNKFKTPKKKKLRGKIVFRKPKRKAKRSKT